MKTSRMFMGAAACALLGGMSPAERAAGRYMRGPDDHAPAPPKTAAELAAEIKGEHAKAFDKVKEIAEAAVAEARSTGDLSKKAKEAADEALIKMNTIGEQLAELDQKMARQPGPGGDRVKSIGEQFVEGDEFVTLSKSDSQRGRASLQIKATITSATTNAAGSAGASVAAQRLPGIDPLPQRRLTVRDLLSPGQMDGSSIEFAQMTGYSRNAANVAEGAGKPQSDIKLALKTAAARVIAHHAKASRQILDDAPALRSLIDEELLYGLALQEESQLLYGDGTGQNLLGIVPQATAYAAPITLASPTSIDMIRLMMLQAALALFPASGVVMHDSDWAWIETLKDTTGRYIIGDPQGTAQPRLWGLPVVPTQAMTIDKVLVGAFRGAAQVFDRWQARVEVATENEDDFIKNMVTILAEERLALAVKRPEAFIYGDFGRVA